MVGTFVEKELQKTNQLEFRIEKIIKRSNDKLYVKRKGYNNSFSGRIDKRGIVIKNHMPVVKANKSWIGFVY